MLYVAQQIPEKEVEDLRHVFTKIDENGNGVITREEMRKGLLSRFLRSFLRLNSIGFKIFKEASKVAMEDSEIDKLFTAIDTNHDDVIEYTEFLAVFMDNYIFKNERYLRMAFEKFDLVTCYPLSPLTLQNLRTTAVRLVKMSSHKSSEAVIWSL